MFLAQVRCITTSYVHCALVSIAAALLLGRPLAACAAERVATPDTPAALIVEGTIPLGDIRGRIDHLAVDVPRQRLYVAELGNDSVGVVDLKIGKTTRTLTGLREPQGIGYVPTTDTVYIANAGDGSVRVFRGLDLAPLGQIALGPDADNVRISQDSTHVFVGYGDGALAVIDPKTQGKVGEIALTAHPESFRLESAGISFSELRASRPLGVLELGSSCPSRIDFTSQCALAWGVLRQFGYSGQADEPLLGQQTLDIQPSAPAR